MRSHKGEILGYLTSAFLSREETLALACIPLGNQAYSILHAPGMTVIDPGLMIRYREGMDIHPEGLIPGLKSGLSGNWLRTNGFQGTSGGVFIFILKKLCRHLVFKTQNASYLKP